jgi:predicted DNA-binding transcriptional regulator AlpA
VAPVTHPVDERWPRGLSRDEAARYIGVGPTKFDELVADGRMPKPKRIDSRVVWDRIKLDAYFTELAEDRAQNPWDRVLQVERQNA